jgi:hypothetical protein
MTGRILSLTLATLISLLEASPATAQVLERVPPPIDVQVTTAGTGRESADEVALVPPGATVRISGTTIPLGPRLTQVRIEVKPASGALVTLTAPIANDRSWAVTFSDTATPGKYAVSAFAADGKNSATTSFTVLNDDGMHALGDMLEQALAKEATDAASAIASVEASLAAKGALPNQAAVEQNLAEVNAALQELPGRLQQARQGLATLGEIAKTYPAGASELEPLTTALQEGLARTAAAAARVRQDGAAASKTLGVCDRIDAVNEVLSAASLWFDLQGLLFQKIVQVATDKYLPDRIYNAAVPAARRDNTEKIALGENLKGLASAFSGVPGAGVGSASDGLVDFIRRPQNLLLDAAQMLGGLAFDKLCEIFTGPVSGTFAVDATVNGGHRFWGYTTLLSGKITLMYEKQIARPGEPIPMTGEIEGNGSFRMYEDLMALNNANRRFVIYHALIPPVGTGAAVQSAVDRLGRAARMATPSYFRVPVKGLLKGKQLTITIGDAALNDFSDAVKGRAIYVVLPPAAPIPYTMQSSIPVQKAQFILSRGLRTTAVLPVATAGARPVTRVAAQSFDRKEVVSNGEVTVTWKLDVKACNPGCR